MRGIAAFLVLTTTAVMMVLASNGVSAFVSGDFEYDLINGGTEVEITAYRGSAYAVDIPSTIEGKPVTSIGVTAFEACFEISYVTIPDTVTNIAPYAFVQCTNLAAVTIPASVAVIGDGAFANCYSLPSIDVAAGNTAFVSINGCLYDATISTLVQCPGGFGGTFTLPATVTSIYSAAFSGSNGIGWIDVEASSDSYAAADGILYNVSMTEVLKCPASWWGDFVVPAGVTSIGDYAFTQCRNLYSVTIPEGVTRIGSMAFASAWPLTSVYLPASVTELGFLAFSGHTNLISIGVDPLNPNFSSIDGVLYDKAMTRLIQCPGARVGAFTVPDGIDTVGTASFYYCEFLTSVSMPSSVTVVESDAFHSCRGLTSVELSNRITYLGSQAFYECSGLTYISLPDSVSVMEHECFASCSALSSFVFGTGISAIGAGAFDSCTALASISFMGMTPPESIGDFWIRNTAPTLQGHATMGSSFPVPGASLSGLTMGAYLSSGDFLYTVNGSEATITSYVGPGGSVNIPSTIGPYTVTAIGDKAFYYLTAVTNVAIPSGVRSIGAEAFGFSGLLSISIPDSVSSIGYGAFEYCISLVDAALPSSITVVPEVSFAYCYSLTSISIQNGVVEIGRGAFMNCDKLASITLPESLRVLRPLCFSGTSLTSLLIPNGVETIDHSMAEGCSQLTTVHLPVGLTSMSDAMFRGCSLLSTVNIPSGVTTIGNYVFAGCLSMTSFDIPDGVTSFAQEAFAQCPITSIHLPDSTTTLGDWCFDGCTQLTTFVFPPLVSAVSNAIFRGCTALTSVIMSPNTTIISSSAFMGCSALKSIDIPEGVTFIGSEAFNGCSALTSLVMPSTLTITYGWLLINCAALQSVTFLGMARPQDPWGTWTEGTSPALRGHAYASADFPAPGESLYGLIMGDYLPSAPAAPVSLGVVNGTDFALLTWLPPANDGGSPVLYYSVYRSALPEGPYDLLRQVAAATCNDTGLAAGSYWYKVSANNSIGEGLATIPVEAVITIITAPGVPLNLCLACGDCCVQISWQAPSSNGGAPVDYYMVYCDGLLIAPRVSGLSYEATGLVNGQNYSFAVAAHNSAGASVQTTSISIAPKAAVITTNPALPSVEAVVVSTAVAAVGAAAAGGVASSGSAAVNVNARAKIGRNPLENLIDLCIGFLKGRAAFLSLGFLKVSDRDKTELEERKHFMSHFTVGEVLVLTFSTVVMALTFLIANKMSILDPSNLLLYLVVAGLAILLHDIAHRYMAWKYRVVSEYKVWWLGATIMFMTSGLFNVAYATPAKAKVGEGGTTLTRRQEAFIAGAGPLISFAAFLVFALMLNLSGPVLAVGVLGASMNLLIAVYSMMPFRPMDGSVVRRWNFFVWLGTFLPMFILYFAMAIYVW